MPRKLIYRPDALANLDEVEAFTKRTWGDAQARRYVAVLVADIKGLRISALRHPLCGDVLSGLRRKRSGMHHIYYLTNEECVEVLNVIHVQRDPALHLKGETWSEEGEG